MWHDNTACDTMCGVMTMIATAKRGVMTTIATAKRGVMTTIATANAAQ